MKSDYTILTDKVTISNRFNEFFIDVSPNLAKKIPEIKGDVTKYIKEIISTVWF